MSQWPAPQSQFAPEERVVETAFCRHCGQQIASQAVVCIHCGCPPYTGLNHCQACGVPTNPAAEMCIKCGVALAGRGPASEQHGDHQMPVTRLWSWIKRSAWAPWIVFFTVLGFMPQVEAQLDPEVRQTAFGPSYGSVIMLAVPIVWGVRRLAAKWSWLRTLIVSFIVLVLVLRAYNTTDWSTLVQ